MNGSFQRSPRCNATPAITKPNSGDLTRHETTEYRLTELGHSLLEPLSTLSRWAGRTPGKTAALAQRIGARAGTLREAAEFGDAVLVAVLLAGLDGTLRAAGAPDGTLAGKTVIDCGNAVNVADFSQVTYEGGTSMAEEIARLSPGAHVVKAFNQAHADVWRMDPPVFDGRPLAVPYAGAEGGKAVARELITALGAAPLNTGGLTQARHLEAMAIIVIRLLSSGADRRSAFAFTSA